MLHVRELANPLRAARGVFYGWWLVGVTALVQVIAMGPLFQGMPAWNVVLRERFGWGSAQLSWAWSLQMAEGSIMGPLGGYLIDKLGSRRMILIGLLILGGGFLLFSQVHNLWMFYLSFSLMSAGAGMGTWLPMMTALNNWFVRKRATAMALAMEGFFIGGVIVPPLLGWAIDPDKFGLDRWRTVAGAIGIFIIAVSFPISRLVRNRPEDYGLRPDGNPAPAASSSPGAPARSSVEEPSYTWQEAIRTREFWLISLGHGMSSMVIVTVMVHLGLALDDRGFSLQMVGWVVATYMITGAVFTLAGGYVGDRLPIRLVLFTFCTFQSLSLVVLVLAQSTPMAFVFAMLLGIGQGGRTAPMASMRGAYFGRKAFASITGLSMVPMMLFLMAAPVLSGYLYDATGNYNVAFIAIAVVSFLGSCLFFMLGQPKAVISQGQRLRRGAT